MHLFSVPEEQTEIISQLLLLQRAADLQERRACLAQLEAQGFTVRFAQGAYEVQRLDLRYRLPRLRWHLGQRAQRLDAFLTKRDFEHPWCAQCRHAYPREAERARAARDWQRARGTLDLLAHQRCANPQCGAQLSEYQLRHGRQFCSRGCWRLVRSGPERHCANPSCSNLLRKNQRQYCSAACRLATTARPSRPCANPGCQQPVVPPHLYCSRACRVAADRAQGLFKARSEKGNAAQQQYKAEHGHVPGYEQRRQALITSNREHPRRRRKEQLQEEQAH
jgi:hypothetical protein